MVQSIVPYKVMDMPRSDEAPWDQRNASHLRHLKPPQLGFWLWFLFQVLTIANVLPPFLPPHAFLTCTLRNSSPSSSCPQGPARINVRPYKFFATSDMALSK